MTTPENCKNCCGSSLRNSAGKRNSPESGEGQRTKRGGSVIAKNLALISDTFPEQIIRNPIHQILFEHLLHTVLSSPW